MSRYGDNMDLFKDGEAYARRTDPNTSKAAAASMEGEPANRRERMVVAALRSLGPSTQNEVVNHYGGGEWFQTLTPRFKPLERKGLIERTGETRKNASGRSGQVWRVTTKGETFARKE